MTKKGFLAILFGIIMSVCTFVGCSDESALDNVDKPSNDVETDGAQDEVVEPSDPVNGFLIRIEIPNECCKVSSKVVEVHRGETPIALPTPECVNDEHTFKYWKFEGQQLLRVSDIWQRIDENANSATVTAYFRRNWTNNH